MVMNRTFPDPDAATTQNYAIEDGALTEVPLYRSHKRAKNWLAIISIDPSSPGGIGRDFVKRAYGHYYYMVDELKVGNAVEFGGDYYSGGGAKYPKRCYGIITALSDSQLTLEMVETASEAIARAKEILIEAGGDELPDNKPSPVVDLPALSDEELEATRIAIQIELSNRNDRNEGK